MATNWLRWIQRKRAKSEVAATAEEGKAGWKALQFTDLSAANVRLYCVSRP